MNKMHELAYVWVNIFTFCRNNQLLVLLSILPNGKAAKMDRTRCVKTILLQ